MKYTTTDGALHVTAVLEQFGVAAVAKLFEFVSVLVYVKRFSHGTADGRENKER